MSHFSVLVITDSPSNEALTAALAPFHEFECTGTNDVYIQDVDITKEERERYEAETERKYKELATGTLFSPYLDRFYREFTPEELEKHGNGMPMGTGCSGDGLSWTSKDWGDGRGYRTKAHYVPEGFEEIKVLEKDYKSFVQFIQDNHDYKTIPENDLQNLDYEEKHKYGYIVTDKNGEVVKVIDRTNPNAKWDWWQVGGRYSGKFTAGYDPDADPNNQETCFLCAGTGKRPDMECANGCNGCAGKGIRTKWPTQWKDTPGNQSQVRDVQWEALRDASVKEAVQEYDKLKALTDGMELPPPWEDFVKGMDVNEAREKYNAFSAVLALREYWGVPKQIEKLRKTREEIIQEAMKTPITCFALLHEGKWYEKGSMGWWGMVSDEQDADEWQSKVTELLTSLDPEKYITVVDCHI